MGIDYLVFGGVDSRDYNIEVFFKDVDHTPKRVYEIVEVPGRNGAIYIDQKRYEDVPVTYDCIAPDDADRKEFVNALAALLGYNRLEDSFNSDEFYNAVFDDDVDPHVTADRSQSTFTLHFTRSAQRYLTDGETVISVDDGDVLTNPTLFEASPLLEVEGYGTIDVNGYVINIANDGIGEVAVGEAAENTNGNPIVQILDTNLFNAGDTLTIQPFHPQVRYKKKSGITNVVLGTCTNCAASFSGDYITVTMYPDAYEFVATGNNSFYISGDVEVTYQEGSTQSSVALACTVYVQYNAANGTITYTLQQAAWEDWRFIPKKMASGEVIADSSISILGNPTYIDCELGEAYKYENDSLVSLNSHIDLGSHLPVLSAGDNEVTFDNTFTDVSVIPRWWKL